MYKLMNEQWGLITRKQAIDLGITRSRIQRKIANGEWVPIDRGLYRHAATQQSWHSTVLGPVLKTGGIASHRCAAALHRLSDFSTPRPEISVPYGKWHRDRHVIVHQSTQWDRRDEVVIEGIPCTGIERTLLDLGSCVSIRRLELASESALRQELVDWDGLRSCLIRHSRQGRDGCGRLRILLSKRHGDEPLALSDWSYLVRHLLVDAGLPEPVLEYRILTVEGHLILQTDLAWPEKKVALELDSIRWHLNRKSFNTDRAKRNRARLHGWLIHEITWEMFSESPQYVVQIIRDTLQAKSGVG